MIGNYVIVNVDCTCWKLENLFRENEIIEIAIGLLSSAILHSISKFPQFIKLEDHSGLCQFCMLSSKF